VQGRGRTAGQGQGWAGGCAPCPSCCALLYQGPQGRGAAWCRVQHGAVEPQTGGCSMVRIDPTVPISRCVVAGRRTAGGGGRRPVGAPGRGGARPTLAFFTGARSSCQWVVGSWGSTLWWRFRLAVQVPASTVGRRRSLWVWRGDSAPRPCLGPRVFGGVHHAVRVQHGGPGGRRPGLACRVGRRGAAHASQMAWVETPFPGWCVRGTGWPAGDPLRGAYRRPLVRDRGASEISEGVRRVRPGGARAGVSALG
jgi:hypothetical protein